MVSDTGAEISHELDFSNATNDRAIIEVLNITCIRYIILDGYTVSLIDDGDISTTYTIHTF